MFPLAYDHGYSAYMSWGLLEGRWPFRDVWVFSFPGMVPIHLLALVTGGYGAPSLRAVDLGLQIVTGLLAYAVGVRYAGRVAGLIAPFLYYAAYVSGGPYHTAQRDGYIFALLCGVLLAFDRHVTTRSLTSVVLLGLATASAALVRPTYVLMGPLLVVCLWLQVRKEWSSRALVSSSVVLMTVMLVPLSIGVGIVVYHAALREVIDTARWLGTVYRHIEPASPMEILLRPVVLGSGELLWLGVGLALVLKAPAVWSRRGATVVILFLGCLLLRLMEGKAYLYQFWPVIGVAAVIGAMGWEEALRRLRAVESSSDRRILQTGIAISALVVLPFISNQAVLQGTRDFAARLRSGFDWGGADLSAAFADAPERARVAAYLRDHTVASDVVQTWGGEPMIYVAARRFAATRFIDANAMVCQEDGHVRFFTECRSNRLVEVQERFRREFLRDVMEKQPRYIVAHLADGSLRVADGAGSVPDFPGLREIIVRDYDSEKTFGKWTVFRLRHETAANAALRVN